MWATVTRMVLRIPLASTTLAPSRPFAPTKLTSDAVKDLLVVAEECEVLCPIIPPPSGSALSPELQHRINDDLCVDPSGGTR